MISKSTRDAMDVANARRDKTIEDALVKANVEWIDAVERLVEREGRGTLRAIFTSSGLNRQIYYDRKRWVECWAAKAYEEGVLWRSDGQREETS